MAARPVSARVLCQAIQPLFDRLEERRLLSTGVWQINGDYHGRWTSDTIEVQLNPNDSTRIQLTINGKVTNRLVKGLRQIQIFGRRGNDTINVDLSGTKVKALVYGGAGNDTVTGGDELDSLYGGSGDDSIDGGLGPDELDGQTGDDELIGDGGDDSIDGGWGDDTLIGGLGDDDLDGETGDDQMSGGWGDDNLDGGQGPDTLRGGDGVDTLDGGNDTNRDLVFRQKVDYWHSNKFDVSRTDLRSNPLKQVTDDASLQQWLIDSAVDQWSWALGKEAFPWWHWRGDGACFNSAIGMNVSAMADGGSASYSQTNVQVAGVDEADLVKTDGQYLYLVNNNQVVIVDATNPTQAGQRSETSVDGWIHGLYLDGTKLTVISQGWVSGSDQDGWTKTPVPPLYLNGHPGASLESMVMPIWGGGWWSKPQVNVTVYDVTDPSAPAVESTRTLDGALSASRDIAGEIYLVVDNDVNVPRPLIITDQDTGKSTYETEDAYRARLGAMQLSDLLPQYQATFNAADGTSIDSSGPIASLPNIYMPATKPGQNLFSVIGIGVDDPSTDPVSTSVVGMSGDVYVSSDTMYVTSQSWDAPMGDWSGDLKTDIYKFDLAPAAVTFDGTGHVPGWTLNAFSMDEHGGYFRIATTSNSASAKGSQANNIFVLQDTGDTLDIVSGLTDMAITERIYAARFIGDTAYLVTYRRTDPLFTVDLSDPTNPQLKGVLEMPGYSSYLQPLDNNLLLGFGRDGDEAGQVLGLQVTLFDVSDIANPTAKYTFPITTPDGDWFDSWSSSAAEWDHHALNYFADSGILAVPVMTYGWQTGASSNMLLLKIDPATGITQVGEISHDGEAQRAVEIGNYIFSIGTDAVKVVSLDDPNTVIATVPLSDNSGGGVIPIDIGLPLNDLMKIAGANTNEAPWPWGLAGLMNAI